MDQRETSRPGSVRWAPWADRHAAVWHQWVVPAGIERVRSALTDPSDEPTARLSLDDDATSGTLTAASRRWRGSWRHRRHRGTAEVELTRLSATSTLVELSLWPATPGRLAPVLDRRRRDRVAAGIARTLGVPHGPRRREVEPTVVRLFGPRPAGLPVVAWAALVALLFTPTVWALVAAQAPTPVTQEQALAEHRARVREQTAAREAAAGGAEADDGGRAAGSSEAADAAEEPEPPRDDGRGGDDGRAGGDPAEAAPGTGSPEAADAGDRVRSSDQGDDPAPDEGSASSSARPASPEVGVYRYATEGGEAVAMPNGSRDYPERTTISVTQDGCGYVERWSVLDERWDERETCTGDETGLATLITYREFFGVEQEHEFDCDEQRPAGREARERNRSWPITCEAEDSRLDGTIEVLDLEAIDVHGTTVETVHLRLDGELSGDLEGTQRTERWIAPAYGDLLIREESRTRATVSSPMGEVDYREDYRIDLLRLRPRR